MLGEPSLGRTPGCEPGVTKPQAPERQSAASPPSSEVSPLSTLAQTSRAWSLRRVLGKPPAQRQVSGECPSAGRCGGASAEVRTASSRRTHTHAWSSRRSNHGNCYRHPAVLLQGASCWSSSPLCALICSDGVWGSLRNSASLPRTRIEPKVCITRHAASVVVHLDTK